MCRHRHAFVGMNVVLPEADLLALWEGCNGARFRPEPHFSEFQLELIKKAWPELHFSEFQFQLELMAGTGTLLFSYTVQSKRFGV